MCECTACGLGGGLSGSARDPSSAFEDSGGCADSWCVCLDAGKSGGMLADGRARPDQFPSRGRRRARPLPAAAVDGGQLQHAAPPRLHPSPFSLRLPCCSLWQRLLRQ